MLEATIDNELQHLRYALECVGETIRNSQQHVLECLQNSFKMPTHEAFFEKRMYLPV